MALDGTRLKNGNSTKMDTTRKAGKKESRKRRKRTSEKHLMNKGLTWGTAKKAARDRHKWKQLSDGGPVCLKE